MNTEYPRVHRVERVDDIPVLLATLKQMKVAEILDRHFPTGHQWQGELTFGEVACVWLCYIASEGDHRLYEVQPWAQQRLLTTTALRPTRKKQTVATRSTKRHEKEAEKDKEEQARAKHCFLLPPPPFCAFSCSLWLLSSSARPCVAL